jgi:tetratricopeptide (TPR) repeat protein
MASAETMHMVSGSRYVGSLSREARESPPDRAAVLEQLERILENPDFDASPRSRAFIRFIVEETLAGREDGLTQAAIATHVFGRRDDFDPAVDPIVRIQAGRLRRSIERYYLLSGVSDPVRIELPRGTYVPVTRWADDGGAGAEAAARPITDTSGWPAVVVRTFEVEGAVGPGLDALARRFEDDLCLEMGRYGDVRVVRREGGSPLSDLDFELAGRLSAGHGRIRVSAQLLGGRSASQVWAETYRAPASTADAFCEETARLIAARVASEQGAIARRLLAERAREPAADGSAYGAVLRSYRFFRNREPADFTAALAALQRVVREQPECALAWVQLSRLLIANHAFEIAPPPSSLGNAVDCALRAIQIDPASRRARAALAGAFLMKGELAAGRDEVERALALGPASLVYVEWIGWLLAFLGEWERGTAMIRAAIARNPGSIPVAAHALWADHLRRGELEKAHQVALQLPDECFFWRALMRACCLGHLGRVDEAKVEAAELLRRKPDFGSRGRILIERYIKFPELFERVVDGLAKAGLVLS